MLEAVGEYPPSRAPDLSVLMPTFNAESFVVSAVESVLGQKHCVADIVISDDCSSDGTLLAVRKVVAAYTGPHGIRLYKTTRRLAIDHLMALVDVARCALLVQAHSDDISMPERLATLAAIHRDTGASLVTSRAFAQTGADGVCDEPDPVGIVPGWLDLQTVIARQPGVLGGARYGMDRKIFDAFPRLDSDYLTIGHDVVQPFRAALLGGAYYTDQRLITRNIHDGQWSHRLWDTQSGDARNFGFLMNRLGAMTAMARDLDHVERNATVPPATIADARRQLAHLRDEALEGLVGARESLRRQGLDTLWVSERGLAASNRRKRTVRRLGWISFSGFFSRRRSGSR